MKRARFFLERRWPNRGVALYLSEEHGDGSMDVARPVTFERVPEGTCFPEPALNIRDEQAQQLMDELWMLGFRPAQGQQGEGERGAMKAHLGDMRALVKKLAGVELP